MIIVIIASYVLLRTYRRENYLRLSRLEGRIDELSARGTPDDSHLSNEVQRLEERVDFLEQLLEERPKAGRLRSSGDDPRIRRGR